MIKKVLQYVLLFCLLASLQSCSVFFEDDLADLSLSLIAPADFVETSVSTQTFIWSGVEGASGYNLMIVSPSFDSIVSVFLDVDTLATQYVFKLEPGKYQWGVMAFNSSSNTQQFYNDLTIIEPDSAISQADLTDDTIKIMTPVNNLQTKNTEITLWWEKVDSATGYHLIIVSPAFDSTEKVLLDSAFTDNKYKRTYKPGNYQWSLYAYNSASETDVVVRSFTILPSDNSLESLSVILSSPLEGDAYNKSPVLLEWQPITIADNYVVEVHKDTWEGEDAIYPKTTTGTTYSVELSEGAYTWGVKAENNNSESDYGIASFVIDLTPPAKPSLTVPLNSGDTIKTSPYQVKWTHPDESGSAIYDSLFIAKDSLFQTNLEKIYLKGSTSYSLYDFANGKWFCKVQSVDKAGNVGKTSATKSFHLLK